MTWETSHFRGEKYGEGIGHTPSMRFHDAQIRAFGKREDKSMTYKDWERTLPKPRRFYWGSLVWLAVGLTLGTILVVLW